MIDGNEKKIPAEFTDKEKDDWIIGSLQIPRMSSNRIKIFSQNENNTALGRLDDDYYQWNEGEMKWGCKFESGCLGLFDGIGNYQSVSYPAGMSWDEKVLLTLATLKKIYIMAEKD